MRNRPVNLPKLGGWILRRMLLYEEREEKLGDFEECFHYLARKSGSMRANLWYWQQIFLASPAFISNLFYWSTDMLRNYLKIALRNIQKQRLNSLLNIIGLAVGIACCLLITFHVRDELSYDRHFSKADRIFRLTEEGLEESDRHMACVSPVHGLLIQNSIPEIEQVARLFYMKSMVLSYLPQAEEPKRFEEDGGFFADPTVISMFDLHFIQGDPQRALEDIDSIIMTASMAEKYFGEGYPLGRTITSDWPRPWKLTGIIEDMPANTHLQFDFLVSMSTFYSYVDESWSSSRGWNAFYTYVLIDSLHTQKEVEAKTTDFLMDFYSFSGTREEMMNRTRLHLQPVTSIHLHSHLEKEFGPNGNIAYVYIFSALALFILLIAGVNFINISTAQAFKRMKEVGVRKVIGAQKLQLILQFLGESLFLSLSAAVLAVFLVSLSLPVYAHLSGKSISFSQVGTPQNLVLLFAVAVLIGVLAGLYPAFFLAAFKPVNSLKGVKDPTSSAPRIRKGLVVFQFAISIFMIFSTFTISRQMEFIRQRDLGFDKDHIVAIKLYGDLRRGVIKNAQALKNELVRYSAVSKVTAADKLPGERFSLEDLRPAGTPDDLEIPTLRFVRVDEDFIEALNIEMKLGQSFKNISPERSVFILNESAVQLLDLKEPLGKKVSNTLVGEGEIIGVVKDFHFASLHNAIEPMVLDYRPRAADNLLVKIRGGSIPETLKFIEEKLNEIAPGHPLMYTFVDEYLNTLYISEQVMGDMFKYFSLLAMFVACLGLFGLSIYSAEVRMKEIGVRKVLGASLPNIVVLLSKEFTRWVLLANIIAWPLGYYAMNRWLQNFAYRTGIGIEIFIMSGLIAFAIALITVSYQSLKAALAHPVDSLRYE